MTTWARVEASRHDHTASHHLMQAPTSQLVRKRVEKERIERAFRLQDRDRSGVIEGPELRRALEELGLRSDDASILAALERHDLDHSGGLDLWEFTTLVREADDAVRQAALDDEETRKRRELRAQRSRATDFFANPEDVTPQANEPSSWAGSQFANHLTLRGPETYTRRRFTRQTSATASSASGASGSVRRPVSAARRSPRSKSSCSRTTSSRAPPQFGAQNSARNFAAAILSHASPTARLQARQPDASAATGARRRRRRSRSPTA